MHAVTDAARHLARALAGATSGEDVAGGQRGVLIFVGVLLLFILLALIIQALWLWLGAKIVASKPTTLSQAFRAAVWTAVFQIGAIVLCAVLWQMKILGPGVIKVLFFILFYAAGVVAAAKCFRVGLVRGALIQVAPFLIIILLGFIFGFFGALSARVREEGRLPREGVVRLARLEGLRPASPERAHV